MDSQKQQVIAIMAAILESGERARLHSGSHVLSAADFVKRAEVIYTEAMPKDFHFHFAHGGVVNDLRSLGPVEDPMSQALSDVNRLNPQECYVALHVYAVDGQDVETSKGEKLVQCKNQSMAESVSVESSASAKLVGGTKSPLRGLRNHTTPNLRTKYSAHPASDSDGFSVVLDCGCRVMKGWRCQFHGAP